MASCLSLRSISNLSFSQEDRHPVMSYTFASSAYCNSFESIAYFLNCCLVLHGGACEGSSPWILALHPIFPCMYSMMQAVAFGFRLLVQGRDGLLRYFLLVFFISRYAYWATHSPALESPAWPLVVSIISALPNKLTEFGTYILEAVNYNAFQ